MNEALLDEMLANAIPPEDRPHDPYDWPIIKAWMTIKLGSDLPTCVDARIGRGINPETGRATRFLRYEWHRELLATWMSLDDLIADLALDFMQKESGRQLRPGSGAGYIIQTFKFKLMDARRRGRQEIPLSEFERESEEDDLPEWELPAATPWHTDSGGSDPSMLADFSILQPRLLRDAGRFLGEKESRELAKVLRHIDRGMRWEGIAQSLGMSRESLRLRRARWGLLKQADSAFAQSHIGRWMAQFFTPDADHAAHIALALGILRDVASSEPERDE